MAASKRNAGVPSALAARQSLNDEELVRYVVVTLSVITITLSVKFSTEFVSSTIRVAMTFWIAKEEFKQLF